MVFAAIDIGSNAIRLLISNVFEEENRTIFKKYSLVRVPVRLGEDAFLTGRISVEKSLAVVKAMIAFKHLMEIHRPLAFKALATSAMRNAENGPRLVEEIWNQTNIDVEIIDGQTEAEIIYSTHIAEEMLDGKSYLYIEVGGGSTELSLFSHDANVFSRSFPVGSVRLLHELVDKSDWSEMKSWVNEHVLGYKPLEAIGTGGNINSILKLVGLKEGKPISIKRLKKISRHIESFTLVDRVKELGLRPDRADVIIPAIDIYLAVMSWAGISRVIVPKVGLADGIIHMLYEKYRRERELKQSRPA